MKIFSTSLKGQMKNCLLAVIWPKKDIYSFFKDCSVPTTSLRTIQNWDEKGLSRSAMIDCVFQSLSEQPDNGTMHFTLMLNELSS
jgi:hypothetical protein